MLRVYRIYFPSNTHQSIFTSDRRLNAIFDESCNKAVPVFDGRPMLATWRAPSVYTLQPNKIPGNFCAFDIPGAFAVDEVAKEALEPLLCADVEFLPVKHKTRRLWLVHALQWVDCLNTRKSEGTGRYDDGYPYNLHTWAFMRTRLIESPLFKVARNECDFLTIRQEDDPDHELIAAVRKHKLTGITFAKVWEAGKPPFKLRFRNVIRF